MPNHDYSIINMSYISLIVTVLLSFTHSRSSFFISLQFFSPSKFENSSHNTWILLHICVPGVSFSKDQALIWRIPSRIKQVELMNMNMEVWSSARSKPIQEPIRVQSFITRFIEKIWSWRELEPTKSTHCSSRGWKFDHLNSSFCWHV